MERRVLVLGHLLYLAVQFAGRSLINAAGLFQTRSAYSLQHTKHASSVHVGCELWTVKAHLHVALCCQVVDFVRAHLADYLNEAHGVAHVAIVQMKMWFALKVGYPLAEVHRATTNDAVNIISFFQ